MGQPAHKALAQCIMLGVWGSSDFNIRTKAIFVSHLVIHMTVCC